MSNSVSGYLDVLIPNYLVKCKSARIQLHIATYMATFYEIYAKLMVVVFIINFTWQNSPSCRNITGNQHHFHCKRL